MNEVKAIADGAPFDTTRAIRTIAKALHLLQGTNMADPTAPATPETPALVTLLNGKLAATLANAGLADPDAVRQTSDEELLAIPGLTEKALKLIREKLA